MGRLKTALPLPANIQATVREFFDPAPNKAWEERPFRAGMSSKELMLLDRWIEAHKDEMPPWQYALLNGLTWSDMWSTITVAVVKHMGLPP